MTATDARIRRWWKPFAAVSAVLALLLVAELGLRAMELARLSRLREANPEAAASLDRNTTEGTPRLTLDLAMGPVEQVPAPVVPPPGQRGPRRWTTWGEFPFDGFSGQPGPIPPRRPDVVRVVFHGGSTTWDGYPNLVQPLLDARFGPGRVEALNLGIPSANTNVSFLLLSRFLARLEPDVVVFQEGPNDLMYARNRFSFALGTVGGRLPGARPPPGARGLRGLFEEATRGSPGPLETLAAESLPELAIDAYWRLSRLAWARGLRMLVATFPQPSFGTLPADEVAYYEAELALLYPPLGDVARYAADGARYNAALRAFAAASGTPLIDVAAQLGGGRETFFDYCHTTPAGKARHARIVFEALVPLVEPLLAGTAKPEPIPTPSATPVSFEPPPTAPDSSACVQGPCPAGACFVAEGRSRLGEEASTLEAASEAHARLRGLPPPGLFSTSGPAREVVLSAFCVDRSEVTEAERRRCVAAGACPDHALRALDDAVPAERAPAIVPTVEEARRLCGFRGGRLPTEAEWERAVRGASGPAGPWTGGEANSCGGGGGCAAKPVGSYPPGTTGLFDGAGNLWEWVEDCHLRDLHERVPAGARDPVATGPASCRGTLRGGSYLSPPVLLERRASQEGLLDAAAATRGVRCAYGGARAPTEIRSAAAAGEAIPRERLGF